MNEWTDRQMDYRERETETESVNRYDKIPYIIGNPGVSQSDCFE